MPLSSTAMTSSETRPSEVETASRPLVLSPVGVTPPTSCEPSMTPSMAAKTSPMETLSSDERLANRETRSKAEGWRILAGVPFDSLVVASADCISEEFEVNAGFGGR